MPGRGISYRLPHTGGSYLRTCRNLRRSQLAAGPLLLPGHLRGTPTIHHTQPWRFGMHPATRSIEVHADRSRALQLADPDLRALHLSAGAPQSSISVSPPPTWATVQVTATADAPRDCRALDAAVARRHTSRLPFTGRPMPEPTVAEMAAAARIEGAHGREPGLDHPARIEPVSSPYGIPVPCCGPARWSGRTSGRRCAPLGQGGAIRSC